ncbi:MAG TPA: 2-C-methyl-D-erythritol 2,4-cyclodiphosphate synthase, partial [Thermotogota bacterium]|nr:2-C-methyl-D-erythritol 2,4-cyclodiphosphate synthase [Thermotogota bacterium]
MTRVGIGYDIHRLVEGRKLVLGGVDIPYGKGLIGHSDADVLIHAIMDALLGAAGLFDIGHYFSPSDSRWANISSLILLEKVKGMVCGDRFFRIANIDSVIVAENPRLSPYVDQ